MQGNVQNSSRELVLTRLLDASNDKVFRCWTEPDLLVQWFAPAPWTTARAELDVRIGGTCTVVMRSPEGTEVPTSGVYLDVIPGERLVFTDAYSSAWQPSDKPFMTAILTFEGDGGRTRYTARVLHWSAEDCKRHEEMGFHEGWGQCAGQLEAVARTL